MRLAVLILGVSASALAQTDAVPLPPVDVPLPPAEAEPAPSSVTKTSPSGVVTLVDPADHQGEAKDTAALLAPTPGVVLSDAGGLGQRKSVSLRGAGATGVLVLLDGVPLSAPGSSVDLARLPPSLTERLEVLRGPAGARYGPGALGGVVNLITRRATSGLTVDGEATWGSFGTMLASIAASGRFLGGDGLLLVHGAHSTGDFGFLQDQQPAFDGNAPTPMVRTNNQASGGGVLFKHGGELGGGKWALDVVAEGGADRRRIAGTAMNPTADASEDSLHGLVGARLTRRLAAGGEVTALGFGRLEDGTLYGAPFGAGPQHQTTGAVGLDVGWSQLLFTRHGLSASVNVVGEWLSTAESADPSWVRAGAMVGDEVFFLDGALAVNATVRVDQSGPFTGFSPRAGVLALLPHGFELRANAGQAHRPPTFLELYVKQGHLAPNPNLRPERGLSADAAAGYRRDGLFVQVGGFAAMYEDLISYEYYPPLLARPYNFQAARVLGLEAEGTAAPTSWLSAAASYTFLSTQNLKDDPRYYGKSLPYRPAHKLFARLSAGPRWIRARGEVLWQSEQFVNRTETVALASRAFVNAGLVLEPISGRTTVTVAFEGKNLLDVTSEDLDGYPLPSRGAYLTLRVAFSPQPPQPPQPPQEPHP